MEDKVRVSRTRRTLLGSLMLILIAAVVLVGAAVPASAAGPTDSPPLTTSHVWALVNQFTAYPAGGSGGITPAAAKATVYVYNGTGYPMTFGIGAPGCKTKTLSTGFHNYCTFKPGTYKWHVSGFCHGIPVGASGHKKFTAGGWYFSFSCR